MKVVVLSFGVIAFLAACKSFEEHAPSDTSEFDDHGDVNSDALVNEFEAIEAVAEIAYPAQSMPETSLDLKKEAKAKGGSGGKKGAGKQKASVDPALLKVIEAAEAKGQTKIMESLQGGTCNGPCTGGLAAPSNSGH